MRPFRFVGKTESDGTLDSALLLKALPLRHARCSSWVILTLERARGRLQSRTAIDAPYLVKPPKSQEHAKNSARISENRVTLNEIMTSDLRSKRIATEGAINEQLRDPEDPRMGRTLQGRR